MTHPEKNPPVRGSGQPARTPSAPAFATVPPSVFPYLVTLFVGVMIISNVTATKGVAIGPIPTDGAFFLFPLAYVLGDVISEIYGFRAMRRAIAAGFGVSALASLSFWIAIQLPAADFYDGQEAFVRTLGVVPQILVASLAGYVVGELLNAYVLVRMKARTGERLLWARLLGSTVVGELLDTLVFCAIAAPAIGISTAEGFIAYTLVGFAWKTAIEILVMPVTYRVIAALKRREPTYK